MAALVKGALEKTGLIKKTDPGEAAQKAFTEFLITSGHFQNQVEALPTQGYAVDQMGKVNQGLIPYLGTRKDSRAFRRLANYESYREILIWAQTRLSRIQKLPEGDPVRKDLEPGIQFTVDVLKEMMESVTGIVLSTTFPEVKAETFYLWKPYILNPNSRGPEGKTADPMEELKRKQDLELKKKKAQAMEKGAAKAEADIQAEGTTVVR